VASTAGGRILHNVTPEERSEPHNKDERKAKVNTLRTGSFKLFKPLFPGFKQF